MANRQAERQHVPELLAHNEETLGHLYRIYADRFPPQRRFWLGLAREESHHATWIRELLAQMESGRVYFNEGRFGEAAIRSFHEYFEGELARAREEQPSLINALSITLYVEEALLELKYFEVAEGDAVELKHLLVRLAAATEGHLRRVKRRWAQHRQQATQRAAALTFARSWLAPAHPPAWQRR